MNLENFKTISDFNIYLEKIDPDGVLTKSEFKRDHRELYNYFIKLKTEKILPKKTRLALFNKNSRVIYKNKSITRLKQFQQIIDENKITNPTNFIKFNSSLYEAANCFGYLKFLIYSNRKMSHESCLQFNTLEKIQKFILENKIKSRNEFFTKYEGIFKQYKKLKKETGEDIRFYLDGVSSELEREVLKYLYKYGINFSMQYSFSNFIKNKLPYRYDFFLKDFNIIIEANGPQHARTIEENIKAGFITNEDYIQTDKIKYNFAMEKGIKVYYFSLNKYKPIFEKYGYFKKVYYDLDELFTSLEIPLREVSNWEESFNNLEETLKITCIEEIQNYIDDNKIKFKKDLPSKLQYKISKFQIMEKLKFFSEKPNISFILSREDAQKYIIDGKFRSFKELKNRSEESKLISFLIRRKKWTKFKYYSE